MYQSADRDLPLPGVCITYKLRPCRETRRGLDAPKGRSTAAKSVFAGRMRASAPTIWLSLKFHDQGAQEFSVFASVIPQSTICVVILRRGRCPHRPETLPGQCKTINPDSSTLFHPFCMRGFAAWSFRVSFFMGISVVLHSKITGSRPISGKISEIGAAIAIRRQRWYNIG